MKIIVTHSSPDWDAIGSVWILKRFLPGWENAEVAFVPAGQRYKNQEVTVMNHDEDPIQKYGEDEVIHVDTGMTPLDHHQTADKNTCAASLCWDYVRIKNQELRVQSEKAERRIQAIQRIVSFIVELDHFREVFWPNAASDAYEFGFYGILEGYQSQYPGQNDLYVPFGSTLLDAMMHRMENRIWAESELKHNSKEFSTRFGKGIALETINDEVIKLAQKMGYVLVIRKDPRKGYVRIKARPDREGEKGVDLTLAYEQLSKMDPTATWYLHVSRKMLLNGTPKNPKMIPTTLSLQQIIDVVKKV